MRLCIYKVYFVVSSKIVILHHCSMWRLDCAVISFVIFFRKRIIRPRERLLHDSAEKFPILWWLSIISLRSASIVNKSSLLLLRISVLWNRFPFWRSWLYLTSCSSHFTLWMKLLSWVVCMRRLFWIFLVLIRSIISVKEFIFLDHFLLAWSSSWGFKLLSKSFIFKFHSHHIGFLLI